MFQLKVLLQLPFLSCLLPLCLSQILPLPGSQNNTFNSTYALTQSQVDSAGINATVAQNAAIALNYERSNLAHGPVSGDKFYTVPPNASSAAAGSLLKLQTNANTSLYTLPPQTTISRILYQTKDFNGTNTPASAYILWPYMPRKTAGGKYPVVVWGHGTSGVYANCGPSNLRTLSYQYGAPYTLALQGYVVVGPDYAGLGVDTAADGRHVPHQYLANPAAANDLFYAVQAAQTAFPELSEEFVVMGHSEGGGAAWAAAQRQAIQPVKGYLGAIAGSPVTSVLDLFATTGAPPIAIWLVAQALRSIFPEFDLATILKPQGRSIVDLLQELQGCNGVALELIDIFPDLAYSNFSSSRYVTRFDTLMRNGGKNFTGPMLVLQGLADPAVSASVTTAAVNQTCKVVEGANLHYATFEGVGHVPVLYAGQRIWLDWIAERFGFQSNGGYANGCTVATYAPAFEEKVYQTDLNFFLEYATEAYELA